MDAEKKAIIKHQNGLHARPASAFIQKANKYQAAITVAVGTKQVNGKSITSVMSLSARFGSEIIIRAIGPDAVEAVEDLATYVENGDREG